MCCLLLLFFRLFLLLFALFLPGSLLGYDRQDGRYFSDASYGRLFSLCLLWFWMEWGTGFCDELFGFVWAGLVLLVHWVFGMGFYGMG